MSYCNDYTLPLWSKPTLFLPIVGAIPNCNIFYRLRAPRAHRIKINCNPNTGLWLSSKHIGKKHQTSIGGALGGTPCRGCYTKSDHVFSVQALTEDFFISKNVLFQHFFTGECVFFGEKYYKQMFVPLFVPKWDKTPQVLSHLFNYPRTNWQNILSFCCYLFKNGPIPASFFFTFVFFDTDDSEYCRRLDLNDGNDRSANWATTTSLVDNFVSYSKMFNPWHLFHFWPYVQGFECAWSLHRVLLAKEPDHSYLLWFFELIRIFHNASLLKYSVTRWYK